MGTEIGIKIADARKEKNMSQNKLAQKVKGLNQSQICKIENGDRHIRVNEIKQIADALNIPIQKLII